MDTIMDAASERIIQNASALFAERGVFGTSLGYVAKLSGISKGTLYYYYPTRGALLEAAAKRCFSRISEGLMAWASSVSAEETEEALGALCDALVKESDKLRLFVAINAAAEPESELEESVDRAMNEWNVLVEVGSMRMRSDIALKMKRMNAAVLPFLCGLAALNADGDYAREAFLALVLG